MQPNIRKWIGYYRGWPKRSTAAIENNFASWDSERSWDHSYQKERRIFIMPTKNAKKFRDVLRKNENFLGSGIARSWIMWIDKMYKVQKGMHHISICSDNNTCWTKSVVCRTRFFGMFIPRHARYEDNACLNAFVTLSCHHANLNEDALVVVYAHSAIFIDQAIWGKRKGFWRACFLRQNRRKHGCCAMWKKQCAAYPKINGRCSIWCVSFRRGNVTRRKMNMQPTKRVYEDIY